MTFQSTTAVLAIATLAFTSAAGAAEAESQWDITPLNKELVRYTTHGTVVHGHQFGFVKLPGACDKDQLWVGWSTYEDLDSTWQSRNVDLTFDFGDGPLPATVTLLSVSSPVPLMTLLAFTNGETTPNLLEPASGATKVEIAIVGPAEFLADIDVASDHFDLTGFEETRLQAQQRCKSLRRHPAVPADLSMAAGPTTH